MVLDSSLQQKETFVEFYLSDVFSKWICFLSPGACVLVVRFQYLRRCIGRGGIRLRFECLVEVAKMAERVLQSSAVNGGESTQAKLVFAYYVTGHGFGHATRVVEVRATACCHL